MKKLLLATSALVVIAIAHPTRAADQSATPHLPTKAPIVPAAPITNWTGCYIGVHAGGGTQTDTFTPNGNRVFTAGGNGVGGLAGGHAGCDAQFGVVVLGVEGDAAWANLRDKSTNNLVSNDVVEATAENRWNADVALRAGVAIDRALIYGKAGAAWGGFDLSLSPSTTGNTSTTLAGLLLGAGIEYAFAPHWSARLEYDHVDYASRWQTELFRVGAGSVDPIPVSAAANVVTLGVSYRFGDASFDGASGIARAPSQRTGSALLIKAPARQVYGQAYDWTGCYIGAHGGGAMQSEPFTDTTGLGAFGGGQVGCNAQFGAIVLGVEGEAARTNMRAGWSAAANFGSPPPVERDTRSRWSADAALRAGVAVDRALLYGKVGAAWADGFATNDFEIGAVNLSTSSGTMAGLLLGAGLEYALAPHWTVKLEFDHIDYVSREIPYIAQNQADGSFSQTNSASSNGVKAGVNYQFGGHSLAANQVPSLVPSLPAAAHDWTGCYAGVHAGGGTQTDSQTNTGPILGLTSGAFGGENGGGWLAGGQAGCNAQFRQIVLGVEGEGAWAGLRDRYKLDQLRPDTPFIESGARENWNADVALRAGVALDRALLYGKVGPAWGGFDFEFLFSDIPLFNSASGTLTGLVLGGGIEYALAPRWSAKLEFDHIDFAARSLTVDTHPGSQIQSFSASNNIVKVGVNYQFWELSGR